MLSDCLAALRRADVRLALLIAALLSVFLGVAFVTVYSFAAEEAVESADRQVEREIGALADVLAAGGIGEKQAALGLAEKRLVAEGIALRVHRGSGPPLLTLGQWPDRGRAIGRAKRGPEAMLFGPLDYLIHTRTLAGGARISAACRLDSYIRELREIRAQLWGGFALALLGALIAAAISVRIAFRPLLRATEAVRVVDEASLARRLPVRGTGDAIDRHAEAVNRVLARLQSSFERMHAFTADAAHELRTPVNRILNVTDVALLDSSDPARLRKALHTLRETGEGMQRLVESLLLLARGEEGELVPETRPFDLADAARRLVELYRPMCEEKHIHIEHRGGSTPVLADPALVDRALANLLDNSFRHTPEGGRICVSAAQSGRHVALTVADSGTGVPVEAAERIFERFVQLNPARTGQGAGLGLPIARMLARIQGGDVRACPSSLGGAAFELRLPRA